MTGVNPIVVTVTNTATQMCGPSPRRKALILSPLASGAAGVLSISMRSNVVAGQGFLNYINGATFPTVIDTSVMGDAITRPMYVVSTNGGEVFELLEIVEEC